MKLDLAFSQNWASCLFCSTWFLSFLVYFSFTWSGIWTAFLKQCESFCFVFIFCHFNLCSFLDLHCQPFSSRWLWRRAGMHGDGSNTPRVKALFFSFFKKKFGLCCVLSSRSLPGSWESDCLHLTQLQFKSFWPVIIYILLNTVFMPQR